MKNPRITKKELNLIKGALRRVFARSELRNGVVNKTKMIGYEDLSRPRVKTWCYCTMCEKPQARSNMVVDHFSPVIGIEESFDSITIDEFIDRLWCDESNLSAICVSCHKVKSSSEAKLRSVYRRKNKT